MTARRCGLLVALVAGVAFACVAALWVPWHPVPGGPPTAVAPEMVFSEEQIRRAESYAAWSRLWSLVSLAITVTVSSALGFSRWGTRLMDRLPGRWWGKVLLGVLILSLLGRLATLPCSIVLQRHRLAHGLSAQSWTGFARDVVLSEAVAVLASSLAMLVLMGAARRWTRVWPAVAAGSAVVMVVLASFVYPVLIEPLFNQFTSLPAGELRSQTLALADQQDVPLEDVLVADASRRTTTLNAYVSGFGDTRRVVVYDTLLQTVPQDQTLSVIAHELAHAAHRDVVTGTALGALGAAAGVGLLALVVPGGSGRRRGSIGDPRLVPFVLALSVWATLASSPLESKISRNLERRADLDALTSLRQPGPFVEVQRVMALRALADPTPPAWMAYWWGSHPTVLERIALASQWDK